MVDLEHDPATGLKCAWPIAASTKLLILSRIVGIPQILQEGLHWSTVYSCEYLGIYLRAHLEYALVRQPKNLPLALFG